MTRRLIYLARLLLPTIGYTSCYTTQLRVGYFYPQSSLLRNTYHNGGAEFELESGVLLSRTMDIWANVNYFQRDGSSFGSIQIVPLSFGVKYYFPIMNYWNVYAGFGGSYTWVRFNDGSPFTEQHPRKQAFGWVVKSGVIYYLSSRIFCDLFADYYWSRISGLHRVGAATGAEVGGLRTGLGIGMIY